MKILFALLITALCLTFHSLRAGPVDETKIIIEPEEHTHAARPDSHAPISIMGDHTHAAGEFMVSYRFMFMDMDGMQHGTSSISSAEVFANNYTVTPTRMTMEMHMLGLMYAPTDRLTLMAMIDLQVLEMEHQIFPGAGTLIGLNNGFSTFTTKSRGAGDLQLAGYYSLYKRDGLKLHAGLGLGLPTGSIAKTYPVPGPGGILERLLPAAMQPGSGTVEVIPSLTFTHELESFTYGFQAKGTVPTYENYRGYTMGDEVEVNVWAGWKVFDWVSLEGGFAYHWTGELTGAQDGIGLNPPFAPTRWTVPTAFGSNYGGHVVEGIVGVNFLVPDGPLAGNRIAADVRVPFYQDLNGYQLQTDYTMTVGWQFAW